MTMSALSFPLFCLDFEASGGGPESYPIEAGLAVWRGVDQSIIIWSALIQPAPYWDHWDWNAQAIHSIERDALAAGSSPAFVAARLNALAADVIVYSDAPMFESWWGEKLYEAAEIKPTWAVGDMGDLVDRLDTAGAARFARWLERAPKRHRAADDAERCLKGFARALGVSHVAVERRAL
jgi:hypothetical protein